MNPSSETHKCQFRSWLSHCNFPRRIANYRRHSHLPLDQGDLWLPGLVETSRWADPSSKESCHERIHLIAQFWKPVNGRTSAALACSTKHEEYMYETSELIPLRSHCSTYSKAENTRDLRIFQWFGLYFQRSQTITRKWDFRSSGMLCSIDW